jgi:hypothetical protein
VKRVARSYEAAVWIAAGLLLTGTGWLATPIPMPLYDGIALPDEPYRYVAAQPLTPRTPAPGAARGQLGAAHGISRAGQETSDEFGPQVTLYFVEGAMSVSARARQIVVAAVPRAPAAAPGDAAVLGNVYAVSASSDDGPVTFTGRVAADITLRAPSIADGLPVVRYRADPGGGWRQLTTQRIGRDAFRAKLAHTGDYALAPPGTGAPVDAAKPAGNTGTGTSHTSSVLLLAGTVAAMALILLGLRVRAMRPRAAAARPERGPPRW